MRGERPSRIASDPVAALEVALAALVVGPMVVVGILLAAIPDRPVTWSLLAIGSIVVALAAIALPIASLFRACRDCWRLARAEERLPGTSEGTVRAAWRWLETGAALSFVGTSLFAFRAASRSGSEPGEVAPLPGSSTVLFLVPFLAAVALAAMVLLRVGVTVGRRRLGP